MDRAKIAWSVITNSYDGASWSSPALGGWRPVRGDADDVINYDLPTLRNRSRDMVRNIPLAAGAINAKVTNVVGTGLRLESQIDNEYLGLSEEQAEEWQMLAEREFNLFALSEECDLERTLNFQQLQDLAFRAPLESGDGFVLLPFLERPGSPFGLKIQMIEGDRVSNPQNAMDTETMSAGVQKDASGAPELYYISDSFPYGRTAKQPTWAPYTAFNQATGQRTVLHLYNKLRIGQSRGVPDLAPVMSMIKQLGTYTDAEVDAAVKTAFFAILTKTAQRQGLGPQAPYSSNDNKREAYELGPATVLDLLPDEDFESIDPTRPNTAFDPFMLALLRQIGMALELPLEVLIKHFTSSYTAARASVEDAKRYFRGRRQWLASKFCQPIYESLIYESVARGRLPAPGFLSDAGIRRAYLGDYRGQWIGPAWASLEELRQNSADAIAEDRGWKTAGQITAERTGGDWKRNMRKRNTEEEIREDAGLRVTKTEPLPDNGDPL